MKLFNKKENFCIIADEETVFKVADFVDKYAIGDDTIETAFDGDLVRFKFQARKTGKMMYEMIRKEFENYYIRGKDTVFMIVQKRGVA